MKDSAIFWGMLLRKPVLLMKCAGSGWLWSLSLGCQCCKKGSRSLKELVEFFLHNHILLSNVNRGKKLKASLRRSEKRMSNSVLRGLCVCQGPQVPEDQPCMLAKGYALLVARSLAHSLTAYVKYLV